MPAKPSDTIGNIFRLPISQLHPHPDNPFAVRNDSAMEELAQSVKASGVLVPAIARASPAGGYELISGHRRKYACELAGLEYMPVIVLKLDDDEAIIQLVDSNIQRENILPSERAKAYKMKLDAMKHKLADLQRTLQKICRKFRRISAATMKSATRTVLAEILSAIT